MKKIFVTLIWIKGSWTSFEIIFECDILWLFSGVNAIFNLLSVTVVYGSIFVKSHNSSLRKDFHLLITPYYELVEDFKVIFV